MINISRLKVYRKGLRVERLHTVFHIAPYNNGFHSANAALIAHELCVLNGMDSASVIRYMLLHDVAEGYVGDTPSNAKRENPDLASWLQDAEDRWEAVNIPDKPELHHSEARIAKAADIIELGMYCVEELHLGNSNMEHVLNNVMKYLHESMKELNGVSDFMEHFICRGKPS